MHFHTVIGFVFIPGAFCRLVPRHTRKLITANSSRDCATVINQLLFCGFSINFRFFFSSGKALMNSLQSIITRRFSFVRLSLNESPSAFKCVWLHKYSIQNVFIDNTAGRILMKSKKKKKKWKFQKTQPRQKDCV